jgi:hypothetical protein
MKHGERKPTLRVELTLPGTDRLRALSALPRLALRVLRARVTASEAWYRVELSGRDAEVKRALAGLASAGCA